MSTLAIALLALSIMVVLTASTILPDDATWFAIGAGFGALLCVTVGRITTIVSDRWRQALRGINEAAGGGHA